MGLPGTAWPISIATNATDEVQVSHANRSFEKNGGNRPSLFFSQRSSGPDHMCRGLDRNLGG
jgi:hypothetical protein